MEAIIYVMAVLLIIAARSNWFLAGRVVDLKEKLDRAQAEIRSLEDKLLEARK